MIRSAVNFFLFQAGWLACVLGAAHGHAAVGTSVAAGVVSLQVASAARPAAEPRLILVALGLGIVLESLLVASGWVRYADGFLLPFSVPVWILALWALFATTLNTSLAWLKSSLPLAAMLGAIGGPLSYLAGERLGGVALIDRGAALLALGIGWSIALPTLVAVARRSGSRGVLDADVTRAARC